MIYELNMIVKGQSKYIEFIDKTFPPISLMDKIEFKEAI